MGPERLDRAKTVESIAAVTASSRALRASVGLVRYPPRATGLAAGAAVCLLGAPAGGHGELLFPTVDAAGRSVGVGWRNRPCVAGIGIVPAQGHPAWTGLRRGLPQTGRIVPVGLVERGADPATGKQPRHGSSCRGRDPVLAASGCGPGHPPPPPPRRCRRALCAGHPLHPMTAGHATDPKQGRDYRYRRPDRHCLRIGYSRSPGGAAKAVLSPSSPPPERPRPHSLAGAPGSGGGSAPVVQLSACGPLPGSASGSTEPQVLTFGMSSQRVV